MSGGFHVRTAGDPARPPLLCLHGFLGSGEDFTGLMPALAERFHVLAPDLPGHGRSRLPEEACTMAGCAAALMAWLGQQVNSPVCLYGYSMGGRLALYLALHYPERFQALALESASPGLDAERARAARREHDEALAARLEAEGTPAFVAAWYAQPMFQSLRGQPGFAALLARRQRQAAAGLAASLRGMGTGRQPSLWSALPSLSPPVMAIVGEHDAKFREIAAQMSACHPRMELRVVPGAGHNVHMEQGATVIACLQGFFSQGRHRDP
ncbi:MAG: 2-succinyl-6-hydroxy-2,4-cyclohexadiene-1-carboxylate synthase [Gammaproteobacteria bacterium]|nr:2-succinyl-6-hydroxy-2,4-cyclohexadiene-1-carboxylate synthase [Gammaproteobacteria bacterium]